MIATFDVPGSVTLAMVNSPAPGETAAQRLTRLAAKALICGVRAEPLGHDRWAVTSATTSGVIYLVDLGMASCTCAATRQCCHQALCLALMGRLPDPAAAGIAA